jgi:hypothetical protein
MDDRAVIRTLETGLGKRVALLVLALVVIAVVVGVVISGFHGKRVEKSADALTTHAAEPASPATPQPAAPAR